MKYSKLLIASALSSFIIYKVIALENSDEEDSSAFTSLVSLRNNNSDTIIRNHESPTDLVQYIGRVVQYLQSELSKFRPQIDRLDDDSHNLLPDSPRTLDNLINEVKGLHAGTVIQTLNLTAAYIENVLTVSDNYHLVDGQLQEAKQIFELHRHHWKQTIEGLHSIIYDAQEKYSQSVDESNEREQGIVRNATVDSAERQFLVDDVVKNLEGSVKELENGIHQKQNQDLVGGREKGHMETVIKVDEDEENSEPYRAKPANDSQSTNQNDVESLDVDGIYQSQSITNTPASPNSGSKPQMASTLIDVANNQYVLSRSNDPTAHIEDSKLFHDLLYLIICCSIFGALFLMSNLPPFFGFMLAGIFLGPAYLNRIKTISQLGVLLILFVLGLEISIEKIRKQWRITVIGGAATAISLIVLIAIITSFFGFPAHKSILFGSVIALSSTTVVVQCFSQDLSALKSFLGRSMLGILIVQDIGFGFILAFLPILANMANLEQSTHPNAALNTAIPTVLYQVMIIFAKISGFAAASWVLKKLVVQRVMVHLRAFSTEVELLCALAGCFLFSILADKFGVATEVGCFVAGVVINDTHFPIKNRVLRGIETLRDLFGALFFASIGLHIFPSFLIKEAPLLVFVTILVMATKTAVSYIVLRYIIGVDSATSISISAGLSQVSEFGFMLASRAKSMGLIQKEVYYVIVGIISISLVLTPFLWKLLRIASSGSPAANQRDSQKQVHFRHSKLESDSDELFEAGLMSVSTSKSSLLSTENGDLPYCKRASNERNCRTQSCRVNMDIQETLLTSQSCIVNTF